MPYMKDPSGRKLDEFDPRRDVRGLIAWYDFAELTSADGTPILRVADKSGLGHDLISPAGYNPIKQTGENGVSVGRFNNSLLNTNYLGGGWPFGSAVPGPITLVITTKAAANPTGLRQIAGGTNTAGLTRCLMSGDLGTVYSQSGAIASTLTGTVADGAWHVLVTSVEASSASQFIDGYLTGSTKTTGAAEGLNGFAIGATYTSSTNKYVGDIKEVLAFAGRLTLEQVELVSQWAASRAPVPVAIGRASAGVQWEETTSPNGQAVRIFEPQKPSTPKTVVLWSHPHSHNQLVDTGTHVYPLFHAALAQGWYVAASFMHGDTWGNSTALADLLDLYNLMNTRYNPTKVILVGGSMGGLATANALSKNTIPKAVGGYFIDPVLNLANQYANANYTASIKTAFGIAADGSDYAAKTAGFDPMLASASTFAKRMRFTASSGDTFVNKAANTDQFRTKVAGTAVESGLVTRPGEHLTGGAVNAADFVAFAKRAIA